MEILHFPEEVQKKVLKLRAEGKRIGFVPTMGALHDGHISLVKRARKECDVLLLSIFVNPLQFGPSEDLDKYPRTLDNDAQLAAAAGTDIIFAPSVRNMYPEGFDTTVRCGGITGVLEGASRPGHFDGVTTVVLKLFNIVQPDFAVFGQKDAQQSLVIKKMIADLNLPVELIVAPTVRESDGLAMSSRNLYLTATERAEVPVIYSALLSSLRNFQQGERKAEQIITSVREKYDSMSKFDVEYIALTDMLCCNLTGLVEQEALLSVVCRTKESDTRLIDNVILGNEINGL